MVRPKRQWFVRVIDPDLNATQINAIIASWNGGESTRDYVLSNLTVWRPVRQTRP